MAWDAPRPSYAPGPVKQLEADAQRGVYENKIEWGTSEKTQPIPLSTAPTGGAGAVDFPFVEVEEPVEEKIEKKKLPPKQRAKKIFRRAMLVLVLLCVLVVGGFLGLFYLYKGQREKAAAGDEPISAAGTSFWSSVGDATYAYTVQVAIDQLQPTFDKMLRVSDKLQPALNELGTEGAAGQQVASKVETSALTVPGASAQPGAGAEGAQPAAADTDPAKASDAAEGTQPNEGDGATVEPAAASAQEATKAEVKPAAKAKSEPKSKREAKARPRRSSERTVVSNGGGRPEVRTAVQAMVGKVRRSCGIYGTGRVKVRIVVDSKGKPKSVVVRGKHRKSLLGKCVSTIAGRTWYPPALGSSTYRIKRTLSIK